MKSVGLALCLVLMSVADLNAELFAPGLNQFEIEFVEIGDPGNPLGRVGVPNPSGSVGYVFEMGKHEISRAMIERANRLGGLQLTLDTMDVVDGGPRPDMPATGISWNEAARFVNWLNESQGYPHAYKFEGQPGDENYHFNNNIILWAESDAGYDPENAFRNQLARFVLPSVDEWFKAAFYDPNANDGDGGYWLYAIGSNEPPTPVASGTEPGTAVHLQRANVGPADITNAGGLSPMGVMAMGGNVWEWEETEFDLTNDDVTALRGMRGGRWVNSPLLLRAAYRDNDDHPVDQFFNIGFRVASIPVPTSDVDFDLSLEVGTHRPADGDDGWMVIENIDDGYRVRVGDVMDGARLPSLDVTWNAEADQWYRFEAELVPTLGTEGTLVSADLVADVESADPLSFGTQFLTPKQAWEQFQFGWQHAFVEDGADIAWEFTVQPIDALLPGDSNGDGSVNFIDFLALANQFGKDNAGWVGGDFDSDGSTDFQDVLILANNFGREATSLVAIPEPSSFRLAVFICFAIGFTCRRYGSRPQNA